MSLNTIFEREPCEPDRDPGRLRCPQLGMTDMDRDMADVKDAAGMVAGNSDNPADQTRSESCAAGLTNAWLGADAAPARRKRSVSVSILPNGR
jgi:hypothetical protein